MRYSTYDLHTRQKELLDKAAAGEEVIIQRRGETFKIYATSFRYDAPPPSFEPTVGQKYYADIGDL